MSKKFVSLIGIVILIIAFSGAAEAAIASSGGGLASSLSGAGILSMASGVSAGHSANAIRETWTTLTGIGAASNSQTGSDAAIDPVNGATVSVNGITSVSVSISGNPAGLSSAHAHSLIEASSDQPAAGEELVSALVSSAIELHADDGMTAFGRAYTYGSALAQGIIQDADSRLEIDSQATGNTLATGTVTGRDEGADLDAAAYLLGTARGMDDGSAAFSHAEQALTSQMDGIGSGSGTVTANGAAEVYSRWEQPANGLSGFEHSYVGGSASGTSSFKVSDVGGAVEFEVGKIADHGTVGAVVYGNAGVSSGSDSFSGLATFSIPSSSTSGASNMWASVHSEHDESSYSATTGSASGVILLSGFGSTSLGAAIASYPRTVMPLNPVTEEGTFSFPSWAGADGTGITDIVADATGLTGATGSLVTGTWSSGNTGSFQVVSSVQASGSLQSTYDEHTTGLGTNGYVKGSSQTIVTAKGPGITNSGSWIVEQAAAGDGEDAIHVTASGDAGPSVNLDLYANTAAMSGLFSLSQSNSASSTVTSSATGSSGAIARNEATNSAGNPGSSVYSGTGTDGTVSGSLKSSSGEGDVATGSAIWGMSAAGRSLFGGETLGQLDDFGITDTAVITSAAVTNPGTGTSTAGGKASGQAKSGATENCIDQGHGSESTRIVDSYTINSLDSGQLASDISAKNGYGISLAYARSGNRAGQVSGSDSFVVSSQDPDSFSTGIVTASAGAGLDAGGRVSGSASASKAVSDDSGTYVREEYNDITGTTTTVFRLTTNNHLTDPAKSEFTVWNEKEASASTKAFAFSRASYNFGTDTENMGFSDAWGGFETEVSACKGALTTTAKAMVKPVSLNAIASSAGPASGDNSDATVRIKEGGGLAYVKTQAPATGADQVSASFNYANSHGPVIGSFSPGQGHVFGGTVPDTASDPNTASAIDSWVASSWDPSPLPFIP